MKRKSLRQRLWKDMREKEILITPQQGSGMMGLLTQLTQEKS